MVGCSGSPTRRSKNFTKLKLIVVLPRKSWKSLEDFRSVTVVTLRFLSLLSDGFGFANLLLIVWIRGEIIGLILLNRTTNQPSLFLSAILITSDSFWWSALLLELLSVAFILNVCGFFIGLRTSFELLPFLYQLRDQIAYKKLKNFIDQLWLLRGRALRYNGGLDDGRRQTSLYRGACSRLVTHRNKME